MAAWPQLNSKVKYVSENTDRNFVDYPAYGEEGVQKILDVQSMD